MADAVRFPIRLTGLNRAMVTLGITRAGSYVTVTPTELRVLMTWAFRATVPRASVRTAAEDHRRVWAWGAHGWRGEWLVNGSSSGIVRIEFDPPGRARVIGVPVQLRVLRVSVDDPAGLCHALHTGR